MTAKALWTVEFSEFTPTYTIDSLTNQRTDVILSAQGFFSRFKLWADVHCNLYYSESKGNMIVLASFMTPAISAYSIITNNNGNALAWAFTSIASGNIIAEAYIGNNNGTLYAMTEKTFPFMINDIVGSSQPELIDYEYACVFGSKNFPACLYESGSILKIDASTNLPSIVQLENSYLSAVITFVLLSLAIYFTFNRYEHEQAETKKPEATMISTGISTESIESPKGEPKLEFEVSKTILGYGSHGTIVFQGKFKSRPVAVKRFLTDFHRVAHHEIQILQQTDMHPNICRYFHQQTHGGFMYLALDLCECTLHDFVTDHGSARIKNIKRSLSVKTIVFQMFSGVKHLHSVNIVHRDIKPHNILVFMENSDAFRVVISDFGMGKILSEGQSSFNNTTMVGGGTFGWRPSECLIEPDHQKQGWRINVQVAGGVERITRAVDIFALGLTAYFALTCGEHPFGNWIQREINIMKDHYRLDHLDSSGEQGSLAKNLIQTMIYWSPSKRSSSTMVLKHPYFWDAPKRLSMLLELSDRLESETKIVNSKILCALERNASIIIGKNLDWTVRIDEKFYEHMRSHRAYNKRLLLDLLRAIRNMKNHFHNIPLEIRSFLGQGAELYLSYWLERFPLLFLQIYQFVEHHLIGETLHKIYVQ